MSEPIRAKDELSAPQAADATEAAEPVVESAALLQGGRSALIRHNGATYRLRATRAGKLILTK